MATQALVPVSMAYNAAGGSAEYELLAISSGASPIAGDLGFKVDNTFGICGTDPTVVTYLIPEASGSTIPGDTRYNLQKIKPTETYIMNMYNATSANATVADADLDDNFRVGIVKATVGGVTAWVADNSDLINVRVKVVGRIDAAADLYPKILVQFLSSSTTFQ